MNLEEIGRVLDREVAKLAEFLDREVKPKTRQDLADLLRKTSERLEKFATELEKQPHTSDDSR